MSRQSKHHIDVRHRRAKSAAPAAEARQRAGQLRQQLEARQRAERRCGRSRTRPSPTASGAGGTGALLPGKPRFTAEAGCGANHHPGAAGQAQAHQCPLAAAVQNPACVSQPQRPISVGQSDRSPGAAPAKRPATL